MAHPAHGAIAATIQHTAAWAETRLVGTPSERLYWRDLIKQLPVQVEEALHDAGYAIVKMGGHLPTTVSTRADDPPFQRTVRVRLELKPLILGVEQSFPEQLWEDQEFKINQVPRMLASQLLRSQESNVAEQIAAALIQ